jgi:hypothetical protein
MWNETFTEVQPVSDTANDYEMQQPMVESRSQVDTVMSPGDLVSEPIREESRLSDAGSETSPWEIYHASSGQMTNETFTEAQPISVAANNHDIQNVVADIEETTHREDEGIGSYQDDSSGATKLTTMPEIETKMGEWLQEESHFHTSTFVKYISGFSLDDLIRAWYRVRSRLAKKGYTELAILHG